MRAVSESTRRHSRDFPFLGFTGRGRSRKLALPVRRNTNRHRGYCPNALKLRVCGSRSTSTARAVALTLHVHHARTHPGLANTDKAAFAPDSAGGNLRLRSAPGHLASDLLLSPSLGSGPGWLFPHSGQPAEPDPGASRDKGKVTACPQSQGRSGYFSEAQD